MKWNFTSILRKMVLVSAAILTAGLGSYSQTVPEYMYFKFDAAGNQTNFASAPVGNNPATLTGLTVGSTGEFGTALVGNGLASGTNNLNTGWSTTMPSTGWTISFWLNNFPATAATTFYYWGDASGSTFRCFTGGVAGNGNLWVRGTGLTDVPINAIPATPTVIHVVYTGTSCRVYFNGVFNSSVVEPTVTLTGTSGFFVGGYGASNSFSAGTLMDEFRMYNRALSDAEVASTWNQPLPLATGPTVVTTAATAVTSSTATLNGTVNANNASTTVTFDYGLTTAYGTNVPAVPGTVTGNTVTPVSAPITGLLPNTLYHYRVNGVNANGTANGLDLTFTTLPAAPTVVTTAATGIGLTTATLNGTVNANSSSTTVTFQYGLTVAYGSTVAGVPSPVTGGVATPVSAAIAGLTSNTLYHYRVVGTNAGGTSNGTDLTFTTAGAPTVVTNAATNITASSAQLNGTVTANNLSTTVTFDWGLTIAYGNNVAGTPSPVTGNTPTAVLANIAGLVNGNTYHFRCNGTNAGGPTNGTDQVFVAGCTAPSAAGPISGPPSVCANSACNLVYSISPILNATGYVWTVPAGCVICSGQNTTSITMSSGAVSGVVSVYGTGACGNGPSSSLPVTVNPSPVPTITGSASVCQGTTGNVYSTQSGMTNYNWIVSAGGAITSGTGTNSITVTWNTSGPQTVSVNYTNASGCSAASATVLNVTVNVAPVPTVTGQTSMCVNSGFYNYTTQSGFSNYTWTVSSGGTITFGQGTSVAQVNWTGGGAQTVSVVYSNANGCFPATPAVLNVTVNPLPAAAGSITGVSSVCGGATGVIYSVAPVANTVVYVWSFPPGANIVSGFNTNTVTVNFSANATSGNVTVYGNNPCGSGALSPPFPVTVTPAVAAAGEIVGPASVCQGSTGVMYSVAAIANATSYTWTVPSGATITGGGTTNSITVDFSASASSGTVSVYGSNSCGNGTPATMAVTLNPVPATPVITAVGPDLSSNAASGNQWYFSNDNITGTAVPGATGQNFSATQTGWYWDEVTLNGCESGESNHLFVLLLGIGNNSAAGVSIYPVPNDGLFKVSITSPAPDNYSISVMNNLGMKITEIKDVTVQGTAEKTIDLRPVPDGVYTVIVQNSLNRVVRKIIVNK